MLEKIDQANSQRIFSHVRKYIRNSMDRSQVLLDPDFVSIRIWLQNVLLVGFGSLIDTCSLVIVDTTQVARSALAHGAIKLGRLIV